MMEKYRLYVGTIQNVDKKIKYSCCDPTMARMLVFASKKPNGEFRVMKEKEQQTFSERERKWLGKARLEVALNNTSEMAKSFSVSMDHLMDALEEELKREKEAMNDGEREKAEHSTPGE
jgi:hypothetical protein